MEQSLNWMESRTCAFCGKGFEVLYPHLWRYKRGCRPGMKYFCSWSCLRAYDERKNEKMGAKAIRLTPEQKSEAFRLAIDGGNPLKYLADLGSPSASSLWYTMKKELKLKDPETYEKLPAKYKGMSKAEPTGKLSDKETGNMTVITTSEPPQIPAVKIDGAIRIETPEKNKAEVVETPETPLKAAVVGKPETAGPVKRMKRYTVSAIRFPEIGEFYFDQKYNMIDWRTPEGEEVSMSPTGWKLLLQDLPEIFETLGVEI